MCCAGDLPQHHLWASLNKKWLSQQLALANSVPSRDTFRGVLSTLNPFSFQKCYSDWLNSLDAQGQSKATQRPHISDKIIEKKFDCVFALKKKHGKLFDNARLTIHGDLDPDTRDRRVRRNVEVEQKHGRLESRSYFQMAAPSLLHDRSDWGGLKTIGSVKQVFEVGGVQKSEVRYYISSSGRNAEFFGPAVRSHWKIENSLHWSLDMTYPEDTSRVRNRIFAENLAWLRCTTLTVVKQHPRKTFKL